MKKITLLLTLCFASFGPLAQNTYIAGTNNCRFHVVTAVWNDVPTQLCYKRSYYHNRKGECNSYTPTQNYTVTVVTNIVENTQVDTRFMFIPEFAAVLLVMMVMMIPGSNYSSVLCF
jgi:hypothetical protein